MDPRPSRRTVVGAAAWTAPAIVLATTAPASAASTAAPALRFSRGNSAFKSDASLTFVYFDNPTLTITGGAIPAGSLTASISTSVSPDSHYLDNTPGAQWSLLDTGDSGVTFSYAYQDDLADGATAEFYPTNLWTYHSPPRRDAVFTVNFTAPGFAPAVTTFSAADNQRARSRSSAINPDVLAQIRRRAQAHVD